MPFRDVGVVRIHRLVETERTQFEHRWFFPDVSLADWEKHREWLQPKAWDPVTGNLVFTVQSFLLQTPARNVLVDTCVGDHKRRWRPEWSMTTSGVLLRRLSGLGIAPEQIDYVVCTHMHADHVGWNTRLRDGEWVPTFPNATYVLAEREWLSWRDRHEKTPIEQIGDSVVPLLDAGRAALVDGEFAVTDEIRILPTPGHTPGHVSVHVTSEGAQAVITGDVVQHPVQCREPGWRTSTDTDPDLAFRTRREFLDACSRSGVLVCANHFPAPSFGYVTRDGDGYDFVDQEEGRSRTR